VEGVLVVAEAEAQDVEDGVAPAAGAVLVPALAVAPGTAAPGLAPTAVPSPALPRGRRPPPGHAPDPGAALLRPTEPHGRDLKVRPSHLERMETDLHRTSTTG